MKKKRIMLLLIIFVIIYLFFKDSSSKTIKQDINKNYSGIGQEKIKIQMVIFLLSQLMKIIKRLILNINKMAIHLGAIINIGVALWPKMVVV